MQAVSGLLGSTVTSQYFFDGGPLMTDGSPSVFVADGARHALFHDIYGRELFEITVTDTQITYDFIESTWWLQSQVSLDEAGMFIRNGNLLSFEGAAPIVTLSVNDATNMFGFSFGNVTFNDSQVAVNWPGLAFHGGTLVVLDLIFTQPPTFISARHPSTVFLNFDETQDGLVTVSLWNREATVTYNGDPVVVEGLNQMIDNVDANGGEGATGVATADIRLLGNNQDNRLIGGKGDDFLKGFLGSDWLAGDAGDDTYVFSGDYDVFYEAADGGFDTILSEVNFTEADWLRATNPSNAPDRGSTPHFELLKLQEGSPSALEATGTDLHNRIDGNSDFNALWGLAGNDTLRGLNGDDSLYGGNGNDTLEGGQGDDALYGGLDQDRLVGGRGRDEQLGGSGSDTFVFGSILDSRSGAPGGPSRADLVRDFQRGFDRIDLSQIDADTALVDDQAFTLIGRATYSGNAGELRFFFGEDPDITILQGDVDGDGMSDFSIELSGRMILRAQDFIL